MPPKPTAVLNADPDLIAPAAAAPATEAPAPVAETPAEPTALDSAPAAAPIKDSFPIVGRLDLRADGNPQARFNLRLTSADAISNMAALGAAAGFDPLNPRSETWIEVNIPSAADRGKLRAARSFELNVGATLTVTEVINDRPRGRLEMVTAVSPVSLLNGGRVLHAAPRERQEAPMGPIGLALQNARGNGARR